MSLLEIGLLFGRMGMLSWGGGLIVLAEIRREVVEVHAVMTDQDFAAAFALAQATPGPAILYLIPIGFRAAGILGAVVALGSFVVPTTVLVGVVARQWERLLRWPWAVAVNAAVAPVCVGLIAAGLIAVAAPLRGEPLSLALGVCGALVAVRFGVNSAFIAFAGGALGLIGLL